MKDKWYTFQNPPEVKENYLVTFDTGRIGICQWTNTDYIGHEIKTKWHWHRGDVPQYCKVIAWRPAPEPYEETYDDIENVRDQNARLERCLSDIKYIYSCQDYSDEDVLNLISKYLFRKEDE